MITAQHSTAQHKRQAFTLSELLVSLAVLGLIAGITLPAVFNSVAKSKKHAVIKEAYNSIQNEVYRFVNEGAQYTQHTGNYLLNSRNILQAMRFNGTYHDICPSHPFFGTPFGGGHGGLPCYVLPTGVHIALYKHQSDRAVWGIYYGEGASDVGNNLLVLTSAIEAPIKDACVPPGKGRIGEVFLFGMPGMWCYNADNKAFFEEIFG
jgi:prepilin-type N-terminal cleavage/methylation domain-containing protein